MGKSVRRIVWAIDVYQKEESRIWKSSLKAIRALTRDDERVQVKPVYVLAPNRMNVPAELLYPQTSTLYDDALSRLERKTKGIGILNLMKPEVIVAPIYTTRGAAKTLVEYSTKLGTDLLVVATHGRSGVPRAFVGSFAESLLLHSEVPIFTVNPSSRPVHRFDHILFPSDFDERSEPIFQQVISFAEQYKARITIIHALQPPLIVPLTTATTKAGNRLRTSFMKSEKDKYRTLAERYADLAKKRGIEADVILCTSAAPIVETILRTARALEVTVIAMAGHSGAVAAAFAGSTSRQVVRNAPCPVWLLHERAIAKAEKLRAA